MRKNKDENIGYSTVHRERTVKLHIYDPDSGEENLGGDFKVVNAYRADIRPCIDCRWCFDHAGCAVKDEWQEVLSYIEECDHIIMASPVYFEEVRECFFCDDEQTADLFQCKIYP